MALSDYTRKSSDFLTINDLGYDRDAPRAMQGFDLIIARVDQFQFREDNHAKLVVYFEGKEKGLLCNYTNATILQKMNPTVTDEAELVGTRCNLYVDPSVQDPNGKIVGGLRVRMPQSAAPKAAKKSPKPAEAETDLAAYDGTSPF